MLRACAAVLCAGAVYLMTAAAPDPAPVSIHGVDIPVADEPDTSGTATRPTAMVDRSCKPLAPVEALLEEAGTSTGSRVDLAWSIRPKREMRSLRWELVLPEDGVWLEGQRSGKALAEHDTKTRGTASVSVPVDGNFRQAILVVRGVFEGSDETGATFDEPFEVSRTLSWGEPPEVAPVVVSQDEESGELTSFIALPTAHREGR